jgi:hypothetical protein
VTCAIDRQNFGEIDDWKSRTIWLAHKLRVCAQAEQPLGSEWIDNEESDDLLVTFDNGSTYYRVSEVEQMIDAFAPEP